MSFLDPFGRKIRYLRLSVTGRCNFRCAYCAPSARLYPGHQADRLSDGEILLVARAAADLGIEKIRVTGGEPLVRGGIVRLLADMARIPGVKKLVLTTNGHFLPEMAGGLREAGVESLNVSLDSIRPGRFARITGGGDVRRVLEGIARAEERGFPSIKINVVVMKGVNEDEIAEFAALTIDRPLRVRFIEYMPVFGPESRQAEAVPGGEILRRLARRYRLVPMEKEDLGGPARYHRIEGAAGAIGIITPLSCRFCGECNRIRVASDGVARGCLFSAEGLDLIPALRSGNGQELRRALVQVIGGKPEGHVLSSGGYSPHPVAMSAVGG